MRRHSFWPHPLHRHLLSLHFLSALLLIGSVLCAACSTNEPKPKPKPLNSSSLTATAQTAVVAQMKNPVVDGNYIYNQLDYAASHFQHREAGFDNNPTGGHDGFAAYWTKEITNDLQGFGPQTVRDSFQTKGWTNRPATIPAINVEVSVPGVTHPEQVVIIGCHYDGEAVSTESAYDDASGCAIELGVARALAIYWRVHHVSPARTLRFVIFDAEEQGLYGSYHYTDYTINGDLANVVAMFNEEQNGINYPLRYLGIANNPLIPYIVDMQQKQDTAQTQRFSALMQQAISETFAQFRAVGMQSLAYRTSDGKIVAQQVFTPDQASNIKIENGALAGSDEFSFIDRGVTQATFGSDGTHYYPDHPDYSYPFDRSQDTLALMNVYASGRAQKAQALVYALAIPAGLTTWMLNQPAILGTAAVQSGPIAAISDVGQTVVGQSLALDAHTAFDLTHPNARLTYSWDFGDGSTSSGVSVSHTYAATGNYTITLTVRSATGSIVVRKPIQVVSQVVLDYNPFQNIPLTGNPPPTNAPIPTPLPN